MPFQKRDEIRRPFGVRKDGNRVNAVDVLGSCPMSGVFVTGPWSAEH